MRMRPLATLLLALLWIGACGSGGADGDTAVWEIDASSTPTAESTAFTASVTRLGCASGVTGEVQEPEVTIEEDRVVVTFTVESLSGGAYYCPGNDWVPYEVEVGEPIGNRELVDGACFTEEAERTSFCADGPERWTP